MGGGAVGIDSRSEEMRWENESHQVRAQTGAPAKGRDLSSLPFVCLGVKQELLKS